MKTTPPIPTADATTYANFENLLDLRESHVPRLLNEVAFLKRQCTVAPDTEEYIIPMISEYRALIELEIRLLQYMVSERANPI